MGTPRGTCCRCAGASRVHSVAALHTSTDCELAETIQEAAAPPRSPDPLPIFDQRCSVFGVRLRVCMRPACVLQGLLGMSSQESAKCQLRSWRQCSSHQAALDRCTELLAVQVLQPVKGSKWREAAGAAVTVWRCAATAPRHRESLGRLPQSGPLTHSPAAGADRQTAAWPCAGPAWQRHRSARLQLQVTGDRPCVAKRS